MPASTSPNEGANRRYVELSPEGQGGFSQTWWPICLSRDVPVGALRGESFLDGRVVVFRSRDGQAHVLSAYCPHMGADLGVGVVVDDTVRCAFHHWRYSAEGRCIATKVGDPPPPTATLFKFPVRERYGLIWAFNGVQPLWEIPDLPYPDEDLAFKTIRLETVLNVDPWVLCCNTPDMQHIKALHGVAFDQDDPHEAVEWTDHSMLYDFKGFHKQGEPIDNRVGIFGTSIYYQVTQFAGRWFAFLAPFGLPCPGRTITYMVVAARKDSGTSEEVEQFLDFVLDLEKSIVSEDMAIMQTIKFRWGTLTKSDRTLGRFLRYLQAYPRAHPSAAYIK